MQATILRSQRGELSQQGEGFQVQALGLNERMPPSILRYPRGIDHWLLIFFHSEASVALQGAMVAVSANTLVCWPPGASQSYGHASAEWDHSWIHLSGHSVPELLRTYGLEPLTASQHRQAGPFAQFLSEAARELSRWAQPDPRLLRNLFENALIDLNRQSPGLHLPDQNVLRVKMMIDSEPARTPSLAEMAAEAHLSVSHFSARFREAFDESPIQYLTDRKIELAMHILRTRSMPIAEVSELVGYADPFHFSRMFKRQTGLSPKAWRESIE